MSTEKRLVLFLILSVGVMYGMQFALDRAGMLPKPPVRPPAAQPKDQPDLAATETPEPDAEGQPDETTTPPVPPAADGEPASTEAPEVALVADEELVLGSIDPGSPYHFELQLDQAGAGVAGLISSRYEAEIKEGQPRGRPLELISPVPDALAMLSPPSLALNVFPAGTAQPEATPPMVYQDAGVLLHGGLDLHQRLWEVVRDDQGRAVRPVHRTPRGGQPIEGQEAIFRTTVETGAGPLTVTKTYRLWPGQNGFELALGFEGATQDQALTYTLLGPHRLPIEGEWYTATYRDVFVGLVAEDGVEVDTTSAYEVVKYAQPGREQERYTRPLAYAGVENQYFALFAQPVPIPDSPEQSRIQQAIPVPVTNPGQDWQKADVTVAFQSKPLEVGPNRAVTHTYRIFAGPKTVEALTPYGAFEVSAYRKGWHLWVVGDLGASFMSKYFITPLLRRIYAVTEYLAGLVGWQRGNWGIAIILLTVVVRMILFPLGRKQARMAKKMQDLQPLMMELKAKHGDNKEKLTQETFALYKQYGVNPLGGCLPALIQLPVLIGLWQTLNNSVALRHSRFLWIDNLAAPDQLFKFPFEIPLLGQWLGPYFNLLPIIVVALMLVQTKLFAPPATTPEAEQQQKMMKYMMIFMAFIFYKVPAGLGIYFITSSLWQIGERLLLPKATLVPKAPPGEAGPGNPGQGAKPRPKPGAGDGNGAGHKGGWWAELRARAQQIVDEADKQRTVRNAGLTPGEPRERDGDRNRPRPRPGRKR